MSDTSLKGEHMFRFIASFQLVLAALFFLDGCASKSIKVNVLPLQEVKVAGPMTIELRGNPGRTEKNQYHSYAMTRTFQNQQLLKEHFEDLDFTVQTTQQTVDKEKGLISQQMQTLKKDGEGDLNAMAYPELGERVDFVFNKQGNIFHVSGFSPNSIFYVPSISLPTVPVNIGDTWPLEAEWMSQENGIPLKLKMITILKRFVNCGSQNCAELEVSGTVTVAVPTRKTMDFKSELRGILYFGLSSGAVLWSQIRNSEMLLAEKQKVQVESCLESRLIEPASEMFGFPSAEIKCAPDEIKNANK